MKKRVPAETTTSKVRRPFRAVLVIGLFAVIAGVFFMNGTVSRSVSAGNPQDNGESASKPQTVEIQDLADPDAIYLNTGKLVVTSAAAAEAMAAAPVAAFEGKQMRLVKFPGPIEPAWYKALEATGVTIVDYVPNYAYLVYGDFASISRLRQQSARAGSPFVWDGEFTAAQRINPAVGQKFAMSAMTGEVSLFRIQLQKDEQENAKTLALVTARQLAEPKAKEEYLHYVNLTAALSQESLDQVAHRPDVISIAPYDEPVLLDERQDLISIGNVSGNGPAPGDYFAWLASKGFTQEQFTASNFIVNVTDTGIDNGTTTPNHFGLYTLGSVANPSRVAYNRAPGDNAPASALQGCDGHGNLVAHIISGFTPAAAPYSTFPYADTSGYRYGVGVAPYVKVGSSVLIGWQYGQVLKPQYIESMAYADGARISNNSWSSRILGGYSTITQSYDALVRDAQTAAAGNQQMVIVFAAGNLGPAANTVKEPTSAKNVLTVGASEGIQAFASAAESFNDITDFSSRGPTADGRRKPDIVAPGSNISGGVPQSDGQRSVTPAAPNGSVLACYYDGSVLGGFFPADQQWYTLSSGTSFAAPAVAGGAALVRQHFLNVGRTAPSPAMTKAVLMNGARYLTGVGANDDFYSNSQGMGLMDLDRTLDGVTAPLVLRDQMVADLITATGQTRSFTVTASTAKRIRITLAWTDAPGSTTGSPVKNDLNLRVTNGGNTYLGNNFSGSGSTTGGTADSLNNVESVYLPANSSGTVTINVDASNINSDGVPGNSTALDQDFALFVTEETAPETAPAALAADGGAALVAESFQPANGVADPGETVTVNLGLVNSGLGATKNLIGRLQPTGGVANPSGIKTYGRIAAGGRAVQPFTFVPAAPCGSTITLTLQLFDGARNLGTVTYTMTLGSPVAPTTVFSENFDGVTAPALPAGWTTVRTGNTPPFPFVTTTNTPDTAPNVVVTNGGGGASTSSLITPSITLPAGRSSFTLSFRQTLNFEGTASVGCFDAGVLELSTDGGTVYNSVTSAAVGGNFTAGGYNGTVSSDWGSPIAGQQAFCYTQAAYGTTTLVLPGSLSGKTIKIRWRGGWDISGTGGTPNWRIDTISLTAGAGTNVCLGSPTSVSVVSSANTSVYGQPVTLTARVSPVPTGGTVNFVIDETTVASNLPVNGSGSASYTTSSLTIGNHAVTASYSGNGTLGYGTASLPGGQTVACAPSLAVTSLADSGPGSLRDAFSTVCAGGVLDLGSLSGEIVLVGGDLRIDKSVSIVGPGPGKLAISGDGIWRVFTNTGGANLSISGITIKNGHAQGLGDDAKFGGAILVRNGSATIANVVMSGNMADDRGGALAVVSGTATVTDSTIKNSQSKLGGGIFAQSATVTLIRDTFESNTAELISAACAFDSVVNVAGSTFSGNIGTAQNATDVISISAYGQSETSLNVYNTTISGNSGVYGAGIYSENYTTAFSVKVSLTNVTVTENSTITPDLAAGAMSTKSTRLAAGDRIDDEGRTDLRPFPPVAAGLRIVDDFGTGVVLVRNSILAGNTTDGGEWNLDGFLDPSSAYNLIGAGANSGGLVNGVNGNIVGVASPMLQPLANYGGPTKTHVPLPNSPAIDAGSTAPTPFFTNLIESAIVAGPILFDQRGIARPVDLPGIPNAVGGDGSDIGGAEVASVPTAAGVTVSGRVRNESGRVVAYATVRLTDAFGQTRDVRTDADGYFGFDDVPAGAIYTLDVTAKRRAMAPRLIQVNDNITEMDLTVVRP